MGDSKSEESGPGDMLCLSPRHAGYLGLLSVVIFVTCWIVGALVDDEWVLFEDNICNLGVSDITFIRVLYPIGCLLTGLGLMLFGYSVARSCTRGIQAAGYYFCIPFGVSMIGIGMFNLDFNIDVHMVFVYLMGVFAATVLALVTMDDLRQGRRVIPMFVILIAVGFAYFSLFNEDMQQVVTISGMLMWLSIRSHSLIVTGSVS